jgi:hypothetical protein
VLIDHGLDFLVATAQESSGIGIFHIIVVADALD